MFNIDGKLWAFLNKMTDLIILNILFVISCIPIITIGASKAALLDIAEKLKKDEEGPLIREFFSSFVKNFRVSTVLWVMYLAGSVIVGLNVYTLMHIGTGWATSIFMTATVTVFILLNSTFIYSIILNLHFNNTIMNSLRNGFLLAIAKFPYTLLILVIEFIPVFLIFFFTRFTLYILTFYSLIGFALTAFVIMYFLENILNRLNYSAVNPTGSEDGESC